MATNVRKNAQVKGRQTKLEKKSHEELVNIVLKKDRVEANLKAQVSNLKGEINSLTTRVNNFDKDQEGNVNEIKRLRDLSKTKQEQINSIEIRYNEAREDYEKENKANVELTEKYKDIVKLLWITIGALVICAAGWVLC